MKKNKKGFTLIELLAVIVILGIIITIVVSNVVKYIGKSRAGAFKDAYGVFVKNIQTKIMADQINSTGSLTECTTAATCKTTYPDVYDSSNMDITITKNGTVYDVKIKGVGNFASVNFSDSEYTSYCPVTDKTNGSCSSNVINFQMDANGNVL